MRMPLEEEGVVFLNFPADEYEGSIGYDGGMLEVARRIVESIPKNIRRAVIVDFDKIPAWEMREKHLEELHGGPLPEEHVIGEAERQLMELLGWTEDADDESPSEEEDAVSESR